ncbi:MAG: 5-(carboxyamino)imidazole ribonucleotide synthase [Bauldia sp.]|nr:5-(carboxyamino)imidazole ribonucleotide synthase [Bauldia sp.]
MLERKPLTTGATVGILGGGQLGRMLALAAAELGLAAHIYSPDPDSPAFDVSRARTLAAWDDEIALAAFAAVVDVITIEFENVPLATAEFLAARKRFHPGPAALAVAQDRLAEKNLMTRLGLAVPPFAAINAEDDIVPALAEIGLPAVLKTRRLGYDGRGQAVIRSAADAPVAWQAIGEARAILESFVSFERELSVLVARAADGATAAYDVSENRHEHHILATATVPAAIDEATTTEAVAIGRAIAEDLAYVGVLAVELFAVAAPGGTRLLVNEIAPRVHNSFHWTKDACLVSQFEQHIRAVAGWPLGSTWRHSDAVTANLLGADIEGAAALAAEPDVAVHVYGKKEARPGRKMGHFTRISPRT